MAASDLDVRIRISADGTAAVTGVNRVDAALDELNRSAGQAGGGVDGLTNRLLQLNLGEQILSAITARMGEVAQMADEWNNFQARIGLVTGSAEEAAAALDGVRKVADATRTDVSAAGDLYTTLARSLKSLGDETTNAIDLTETIAQAMALSGRGASENQSAITQFSQALASGVLRGDEFNSMMENAPRLIQALADALGTTTGKLRAMAEEGKLTADILVAAFKDQAGVIASEFATLPLTIGGAITNLGNAVKGLIGDFDDTSAASTQVAEAIQGVATHLEQVATVAAGAGLAAMAAGAVKAATAMQGLATATLAARTARIDLAIAERTALASASESLAANQAAAVSYAERAAAAVTAARQEVAAAEQAAIAARENLLLYQEMAIYGSARAAAEREVTAAVQAHAVAEQQLATALQAEAAAANNATLAAAAASRAQAAAAASAGLWARTSAFLGASVGLLKNPLNAMTGVITAIMAYDFGKWLANSAKEAQAWYNPLILIKGALAGLEWSMRKLSATYDAQRTAEDNLQESQARQAEILKQATYQTGLAFQSFQDFKNAVEKGAVIWDSATKSWIRGAVSLETARAAVTKLDAALQTQGQALELVAKREEAVAKLAAQRREQTIQMAKALGDESVAMQLTAAARQEDVVATERGLAQSQAALANSQARLDHMIKEAAAGKGLTEQKQAEINSLTSEVETKKQAVAAAQLAIEAARLEQVQAQLAADTYGDQSTQLTDLTRAQADAADTVARITQAQKDAAAATLELAQAEAQAAALIDQYRTAQAASEAGNQTLVDSLQDQVTAYEAASQRVVDLRGIVAAGAQADQQAAAAKEALALANAKLSDAARDLIAKREREAASAERVTTALTQEGALRVTHLRNLAREAEARGETSQAMEYQQQALDAEITALERLEAAKQREVVTAQAILEAKQKEIDLDGSRSDQEKEAIAQAEAVVATKKREAEAISEAVRAKEEEAAIAKDAAQAQRDAADATDQAAQQTQTYGDSIGNFNDRIKDGVSVQLSWAESLARTAAGLGINLSALGNYTREAEDAYQAARQAHQAQWDFNTAVGGMSTVASTAGSAMQRLARQEVEAAVNAATLARAYDTMQAKAAELRAEFDRGDLGLSAYASQLQALIGANRALGEEKLQSLRDALRDAREQMADFTDSARDGLRQLQIEWANLNNNQAEAENLEYQRDRLEIEQQLIEAQQAGNAQAIAALQAQLALLAKIHAKKLADLKDEQAATADVGASTPVTTPGGGGGGAASMGSNAATGNGSGGGMSAPVGGVSYTTNVYVQGTAYDAGDRAAMTNLTRKLQPYFDDLTRRGR